MSHFVSTIWEGSLTFGSKIKDHTVRIDSNGPSPKPLLLSSLAGCTGIDVVEMLQKMRVKFTALRMDIKADLTTEHPKVYSAMYLDYFFEGDIPKPEKVVKAVRLSQEKYCGVSAMIRMICPLTYSIYVNGGMVLGNELSKGGRK